MADWAKAYAERRTHALLSVALRAKEAAVSLLSRGHSCPLALSVEWQQALWLSRRVKVRMHFTEQYLV